MIDLWIYVTELTEVWENYVSEYTMTNCFTKARFNALLVIKEQDTFLQNQKSWKILHSQDHITDGILFNEFLTVNHKLIVADYPIDEDILTQI